VERLTAYYLRAPRSKQWGGFLIIKSSGIHMTPEERLRHWLAEEQDTLERLRKGAGPGVARREELEGKSGLEILRQMMAGELPYAECAKSLNFCAIKAEPGYALFQGITTRDQLNPMGTVHGGWISSILDSALGCAVLSSLPAGQVYSTTGLDIRYRKFLTLNIPRVRVEAKVTRTEAREAFADARLFGPDDTVYAEASTTCRVARIPVTP
jgi:uncharacterized protein (TIGR00369 family)